MQIVDWAVRDACSNREIVIGSAEVTSDPLSRHADLSRRYTHILHPLLVSNGYLLLQLRTYLQS